MIEVYSESSGLERCGPLSVKFHTCRHLNAISDEVLWMTWGLAVQLSELLGILQLQQKETQPLDPLKALVNMSKGGVRMQII